MDVFIAGSGKLANAILNAEISIPSCEIKKWNTIYQTFNHKAVLVHAGSGRQLKECFEFCSRTKSIFIELSTGLETEKINPDFPLIICPNTSILVLKTLNMLMKNGADFKKYEISITESHQASKATEPGTAFAFAEALDFSHNKIVSIRDRKIQQNEIEIPEEYLDRHAYHKIVIKDGKDEISLETKVLGHSSYAKGVQKIIEAVLQNDLENKKYTVLDLINMNML